MMTPIQSGLCVLHHCDNPPCCNPSHLFLGTHADNMRDKMEKGRHRFGLNQGERHGNAKLTPERVRSMRMVRELGASYRQLADMFGVSHATVGHICTRKTWKHV